MSTDSQRFVFLDNYTDYWSLEHEIPASSIDDLGHVTAAFYPAIFEATMYPFLSDVMGRDCLDYVVARLAIDYRREVLLDHGPVTVYVAVDWLNRSSFGISMVLQDVQGAACTQAEARYVAWDRALRGRRLLEPFESEGIERYRRATSESLPTHS